MTTQCDHSLLLPLSYRIGQ